MKVTRKIIEIDEEKCTGCGECVPSCAEGAIRIEDGKARLLAEKYCDGLGACLGECPEGALRIVEREADDFDEEAVEILLKEQASEKTAPPPTLPCGCPSTQLQSFGGGDTCAGANKPAGLPMARVDTGSQLAHWPVQIKLVPPTAPFLRGADLVVAADCVPVAYAGFHEDFLKGRVVMIGCPKFDNSQEYLDKFTELFRWTDLKSVTVVRMEVPCCGGLPTIVRKAHETAHSEVPLEEVVIGVKGEVQSRQ